MTNDVSNWFRYFSNDQNGVLENCLASHTNKNPTAFSPWFFFSEWGEERAIRCTKPKIITFVSNAAVDRVFFDAKPSCWRVCCYSCNFMHFFCFALRAHGMRANKSDNANNRQRLQIPTFMCCYAMVCCADVLCNFSNCLTLELQKIQSQTAGRKRERESHASFTMSRLLFWLYVISVTLFNSKKISMHFTTNCRRKWWWWWPSPFPLQQQIRPSSSSASKEKRTYRPVYGIFVTT